MKFEDVLCMDEAPFDVDILERVYYSPYCNSPSMPNIYAILIFNYFMKFDERYGTQLTNCIDVVQILSMKEGDEDILLWNEDAPLLMQAALWESGWISVWFSCSDDLSNLTDKEPYSEKGREQFHEKYPDYIEKHLADSFVRSCFLQEEDNVYEATFEMDEGYFGIIWNYKLDMYEKLQEKNRKLISALCPEEDRYISCLKEEVWKPYIDAYVRDTENCEGTKYVRVMIGCDGYNFFYFDAIDPNWICKAAKLGKMLDIVLEKIEDFLCSHKKEHPVKWEGAAYEA